MIKKVEIENFKCFIEKSIGFEDLTVLSGVNAVGKSSTIQVLLLCIQNMKKMNGIYNENSNNYLSLKSEEGIHLGSVNDIGNYSTDLKDFMFRIDLTNDCVIEMKSEIKREDNINFHVNTKITNMVDGDLLSLIDKIQFVSAERLGPMVSYEDLDISYDVGVYGQNSVSILCHLDLFNVEEERCFTQDSIRLLPKAVEEWMNYIVPGTELYPSKVDGIEKTKMQIKNSKESKWVKPIHTGFGISYLLPIIVAAMIAPKGSAIIVENPEAHLHPLGQSRMGEFLSVIANSEVQVIVETHSDHLINAIRKSVTRKQIDSNKVKINFFEKIENDVIITELKINNIGEIDQWPTGFLDQEKMDLKDMFEARIRK